jgi:hypothetical protein
VLFGKWSGTEVKIDGVEYLIMKESDIMGVLTEATTEAMVAELPKSRRCRAAAWVEWTFDRAIDH